MFSFWPKGFRKVNTLWTENTGADKRALARLLTELGGHSTSERVERLSPSLRFNDKSYTHGLAFF